MHDLKSPECYQKQAIRLTHREQREQIAPLAADIGHWDEVLNNIRLQM